MEATLPRQTASVQPPGRSDTASTDPVRLGPSGFASDWPDGRMASRWWIRPLRQNMCMVQLQKVSLFISHLKFHLSEIIKISLSDCNIKISLTILK